jgi:hypothetical protein
MWAIEPAPATRHPDSRHSSSRFPPPVIPLPATRHPASHHPSSRFFTSSSCFLPPVILLLHLVILLLHLVILFLHLVILREVAGSTLVEVRECG